MIILVTVEAFKCSICSWLWFNRKDGVQPKRCPRRSCRKRATFTSKPPKDKRKAHDPSTCRTYACVLCVAAGKKF